jgi:hypothetical protein
VLRQQADEVAAVHVEDHLPPVVEPHAANRVVWEASAQQRLRLVHDVDVLGVEEEPQTLCPGHLRDVAIAEVEAEQLGVRLRLEHDPA